MCLVLIFVDFQFQDQVSISFENLSDFFKNLKSDFSFIIFLREIKCNMPFHFPKNFCSEEKICERCFSFLDFLGWFPEKIRKIKILGAPTLKLFSLLNFWAKILMKIDKKLTNRREILLIIRDFPNVGDFLLMFGTFYTNCTNKNNN